ncbi:MAG: Hsp20/alpha crystallin family protein [Acidobacteria bacterium]|nr:Hsp20/alpha crystallin family protein [Acidobacteriota bacterium]MBI3657936.1 Hsp20/alpha crystallin family protein [Acidobacteriota bacterium]
MKVFLPIHNRLSALFEEPERRPESHVSTWSPPVDILETKASFVVTAEVPGMNKDDLKITVGNNWISLRGDRKSGAVCSQENYYRLECVQGRFHRCFEFAEDIDLQKVTASLDEGILEVTLAKAARRGSHD